MNNFTHSSFLNILKFFFLTSFLIGIVNLSKGQQAPVAVNDSITIIENSFGVIINVQANDMDPNNDPLTTSVISGSTIGGASIVLNGDSIQYTPPANLSGQDTLVYTVCDFTPLCDTASIFITINPLVGIGTIENNFDSELSLYPNPTTGDCSIDLGDNYKNTVVTMMDLVGRTLQIKRYNDRQLLTFELNEPAGVYLLVIESDNKKGVIRVIKE